MSVVVVTGGSRGIGAEVCRRGAAEGWTMAINYARSAAEAENLAAEIRAAGGEAAAFQADVADESQVVAMFEKIDRDLGPVTGLVNNAGVNGAGTRVDELDLARSRRCFEVNTLGAFICAKHAIRRMARGHGGDGGVIVNVSSAAARHGGAFSYVDYAASKAALDTLTIGLARETAAEGIRVNTLRPGITLTEISTDYAAEHPEWLDWVMQQVPLGRPARVGEIADGIIYLLSERSSYATGAILDMSGGWVSP